MSGATQVPVQTRIRTCTNVVPIRVVRGKLLEGASFHEVHPSRYLEFARTLEVGCVCRDEGLRAISHTDTRSAKRYGVHFEKNNAPDVSYARHFEWWGKEERLP